MPRLYQGMSCGRIKGKTMNTVDILVIGAGPAGSMAALTSAENGLAVLLVERHNTIGNPVRCAEGVDERGISEFFDPDPSWTAAIITGYNLMAPDGTVVEMNTHGAEGYILERLIFDRMVAERAAEAGAAVMTGVEAVGMSEYCDGSRVVKLRDSSKEWQVRAGLVIAADGVESCVGRWAGLNTAVPLHDMETCAQVILAGVDIDPHCFAMYFTRKFAPGGYAWVFPKGDKKANVGIGISGDNAHSKKPVNYLDNFLEKYFPDASVVSRTIGGVPCTGGIKKILADGVMAAGDSAHMANPITGGGIVNALAAGRFAGETASEVFHKRSGDTTEKNLIRYQKRCNNRFGKMNRRCYRLKEAIANFPDSRFNEIAHEIIKIPVSGRTPVRVLRTALFNKPELIGVLAKVILG